MPWIIPLLSVLWMAFYIGYDVGRRRESERHEQALAQLLARYKMMQADERTGSRIAREFFARRSAVSSDTRYGPPRATPPPPRNDKVKKGVG